MPNSKRSKTQWQALFKAYEDSRLSGAAFCREHNLPVTYFRTKYRERDKGQTTAGFSRVAVITPGAAITVTVGEVQIRCDTSVPSTWLADLVQQMRS